MEVYIAGLRRRGVRLWLEGDKLGFQAPKGTLSAEDVAELRVRKPELMVFLQSTQGAASNIPPLVPRPRPLEIPQSFAQQRLWFLYNLNGPDAAYNIVDRRRLLGVLDRNALEGAFLELCRRHEILRSTFGDKRGQPVQIIASEAHLDFLYLEAADTQLIAAQEAAHCFDLEHGPLFRVRLLQQSAEDHVLLLTAHHIICDGWSLGILFRELSTLYSALRRGEPGFLSAPTLHYADYALWQQSWLGGPGIADRLSYWTQLLDGAQPVLDLFPHRSRATSKTTQGASHEFRVSSVVAGRFKNLCQENGSTVFMGMLAAFQYLLARYTNSRDIVLGTQVAGRNRAELEGILGFMVNTLALRLRVDPEETFPQLLKRVGKVAMDCIANEEVPFEKVVEALQPERLPGRNPLVQVMLLWQNAPIQPLAFDGVLCEAFEAGGRTTAKFDLTLEMGEVNSGFEGVLEYRTELYTAGEMKRLAGHLVALLEAIVDEPSKPLHSLSILTESERLRLKEYTQGEQFPAIAEKGIAAQFEACARLHPDRPALVFGDLSLTYAELNEKASRLATHLQELGATPELPVALLLEPSADLIVAILAVLKAGSYYLPLDTRSPEARRSVMLDDAQTSIILTSVPEALPLAAVIADPNPLAYIIYTSGSTGTPKGVMIEQRRVLNLANWLGRDVFGPAPVRTALFASCAFDASVQQIFGCLLNGHTLYPVDAESRRDGVALRRFFQRHSIELADGTPTLLSMLCEAGVPSDRDLTLRTLLIGGEPLPTDLIARFYRRDPEHRIAIYNVYGPTECCVDSTWRRVDGERQRGSVEPIGRPIPNCEVLILDPHGQPAPVGVAGEIWIAGAGVGQGYWRRPELTAAAFVPHPERPSERMYRTGDHGYWNEVGEVEFLGRTDDQVKIRGHRIQLGDIESHLLRHPEVSKAAVVARPTTVGQKELVAYLVAESTVTVIALRHFLADVLPEYMLPSSFVMLDQLPQNANGKVDRLRLPAPRAAMQPQQGSEYVPPRNEPEKALAEVWGQVLGRERISVRDHYIALGGDSIKALQIAARLRDNGWKLELGHLFQHPHIEDLAPLLQRLYAGTGKEERAIGDALLSPAQARFFEEFEGATHFFNQSNLLTPRERLQVDHLHRALEVVVAHHDILRATFIETPQGWRQSIAEPGGPVSFRVLDVPFGDITKHANMIQRSFDVHHGPLFQAVLFCTPDGQRLLLAAHHLVVDGVSWRILLEDLELAYRQFKSRKPVRLPAKTTPFRVWSAHLHQEASEFTNARWLQYDAARPIDQQGPACYSSQCATHRLQLSRSLTADVLEHCHRAYGTEANDILLTALARAVRRHTGLNTLPVLLESHGRESASPHIDLSRTVGWFTAIYPVLLDLGPTSDPGRNIKLVKETLRAIPHKGIGYGIRRYLSRDLLPTQEPRVIFNYLGQFNEGKERPSLFTRASEDIGPMADPEAVFSHDIEINGLAINGRLEFTFSYNPLRLRDGFVSALAEWFVDEMERLTGDALGRTTTELTPSDIDYNGFNMDEMEVFLNNLSAGGTR